MTPSDVIRMFGGVLEYAVLTELVTRRDIAAALAAGDIVRLRRGRYALSSEGARATAVAAGGTASHLSAALHHGWKVKHVPDRPTITVPRNKPRPAVDADLRWGTVRPDERSHGFTRPIRTVIDCARTCPYDEALSVADSALRSGVVTREELLRAAAGSPRTGRTKAITVITRADGRAANPFESCTRAICHGVDGLSVEPQVWVGGVGRVDLADRRLRIFIECDSYEFHSNRTALRKDIRRYTEGARRDWVVLRFTWEQVMSQPDYVRGVLVDVVRIRTTEAVRCSC